MSNSYLNPRVGAPELDTLAPDARAIVEGAINKLGGPFGPRMPLLHSPDVALAWSQLGRALKKSELKDAWRELAILVVGQHWQADFEWHAHASRAVTAGVTPAQLDTIKSGEIPAFDDKATSQLFAYCRELVHTKQVSDSCYDATRKLLGDKVLVELTALLGHFTNVAMTLNAHHVQLPPGVPSPFGGKGLEPASANQVQRTGWVERDGKALRYRERPGSGVTLVFIHELGGTLESWDACIGFLPPERAILSLEWRGAGLSSKVHEPLLFNQMVDDLQQVVSEAVGSGPMVLIGVAAGAAAALRLAARSRGQIAGVVAVTPALGTPAEQRDVVSKLADRIEREGMQVMMGMERSYPARLREAHPERWAEFRLRYLGNDPTSYAHLLRMVMDVDLSEDIGRIQCPALVIGGSLDLRPVDMMRALASQIPHGTVEEIDAGHFMPSQAPDLVAQAIERFVVALPASASNGV
jgi:3-oxoadipate enol-lactonase